MMTGATCGVRYCWKRVEDAALFSLCHVIVATSAPLAGMAKED